MFQTILTVLFPLIALIAMGFGLKQSQWLSLGFWQSAEKLNYYLLFPIMLFMSLATARLELNILYDVVLILTLVTVLVSLVLYGVKKVYQIPICRFGVYVQSLLRFNTYIGIALISSVFQQAGMTIFAVIMVFFIPVVNVLSVLSLTDLQQLKIKHIILNVVKNPLILGCLVGGTFNLCGFTLWQSVDAFFKLLAACSLPLGLMCVGAALRFQGIQTVLWRVGVPTLTRLWMMPMLAYGICRLFDMDALTTQVITLFFALPTASASYILTKVYGGDSELMASIISVQTVAAAPSLVMILALIY